jgi:hypothetical protein
MTKTKPKTTEEIIAAAKNAGVTLTVVHEPKSQIVTKAISVVVIAVGVVAVAALAKKWVTPGDVYVPEVPSKPKGAADG